MLELVLLNKRTGSLPTSSTAGTLSSPVARCKQINLDWFEDNLSRTKEGAVANLSSMSVNFNVDAQV